MCAGMLDAVPGAGGQPRRTQAGHRHSGPESGRRSVLDCCQAPRLFALYQRQGGGRGSPGTATPDGQAVPPPPAGTSGPSSWHPVPVSDSRLLSVETCASVCSVCGAGRGGCGGSRPGPAASLRRRLRRRGCPPSPQRGEAAPPFQPVGLPAHPRGRTPRGAEASCCSELGLRLVTSEVVVSADLVCQLPGFSVPFPLSASRAHSRAPSPDSAAGAAGPCGPRAGSCA